MVSDNHAIHERCSIVQDVNHEFQAETDMGCVRHGLHWLNAATRSGGKGLLQDLGHVHACRLQIDSGVESRI